MGKKTLFVTIDPPVIDPGPEEDAMELGNATPEDARIRVTDASIGSLAHATDDYVFALRGEILRWLARVEDECTRRVQISNQQMETALEAADGEGEAP